MLAYRVEAIKRMDVLSVPWVPVEVVVLRESEPSNDYLLELKDDTAGVVLAVYGPLLPATQWFSREAIYREVLAQVYEYSEPRMGVIRWPTVSESVSRLMFNVTEGDGGNKIPTVPARTELAVSVDRQRAVREAVVIEKLDDGQWRIAGYGNSQRDGFAPLNLQVTTSGTLYALGIDDYGTRFVPGMPVIVGQRVRPNQFAGWLYEVTEPGVLPATEPQWWALEGDNPSRPLGTARAIAVRYYRPLAHGPVPVEML